MRIELTWPRSGTEDRTLTLALPGLPATGLLRPALRYTSRLRALPPPSGAPSHTRSPSSEPQPTPMRR